MLSEEIAKDFHEALERHIGEYGYLSVPADACLWEQLPECNRELLCAVFEDLREREVIG